MSIVEKAKSYAIKCHEDTNHRYDNFHPYSYHLEMAVGVAMQFIHLIPEEERDDVIAAVWCHDVIEDTRQTYNDVKEATNKRVADLAYALTNEKGRNRRERANDKYYDGILMMPRAVFVKLCDRIANVQHSFKTNSRMISLYAQELRGFTFKLYSKEYAPMFEFLEGLFDYSE